MARIYANENFPLPVVIELRRMGHDVLTVPETGGANQAMTDAEVLSFARSENRVLLTFNRKHFIMLHLHQPNHAGMIVCTFNQNFVQLAALIDAALRSNDPMSGKLVRVNRPQ